MSKGRNECTRAGNGMVLYEEKILYLLTVQDFQCGKEYQNRTMLRDGMAQDRNPAGVLRLVRTVLIEELPSCDHMCLLDEYLCKGYSHYRLVP